MLFFLIITKQYCLNFPSVSEYAFPKHRFIVNINPSWKNLNTTNPIFPDCCRVKLARKQITKKRKKNNNSKTDHWEWKGKPQRGRRYLQCMCQPAKNSRQDYKKNCYNRKIRESSWLDTSPNRALIWPVMSMTILITGECKIKPHMREKKKNNNKVSLHAS